MLYPMFFNKNKDILCSFKVQQGRIQTIWKLWFHKVKLSNSHKIGKYGKEIGGKSGKLLTKSGKIGIFTWSVLTLHPLLDSTCI